MTEQTLVRWIIAYPMATGYMTESQWNAEVDKFKVELRKFWAERGIVVRW